MLAIIFIVVSIKYSYSLNKSKKIAFDNGVDKEDYDILIIGLWFYIIPPTLAFFLPFLFKIYFLPLLVLPYTPSIYYGLKISKKLDKGYDFVRKLGKQVNQVVWIGYAGIGLVIFNIILLYTSAVMKGI